MVFYLFRSMQAMAAFKSVTFCATILILFLFRGKLCVADKWNWISGSTRFDLAAGFNFTSPGRAVTQQTPFFVLWLIYFSAFSIVSMEFFGFVDFYVLVCAFQTNWTQPGARDGGAMVADSKNNLWLLMGEGFNLYKSDGVLACVFLCLSCDCNRLVVFVVLVCAFACV